MMIAAAADVPAIANPSLRRFAMCIGFSWFVTGMLEIWHVPAQEAIVLRGPSPQPLFPLPRRRGSFLGCIYPGRQFVPPLSWAIIKSSLRRDFGPKHSAVDEAWWRRGCDWCDWKWVRSCRLKPAF